MSQPRERAAEPRTYAPDDHVLVLTPSQLRIVRSLVQRDLHDYGRQDYGGTHYADRDLEALAVALRQTTTDPMVKAIISDIDEI